MSEVKPEMGLTERLERLRDDDETCSIPVYENLAERIRSSASFISTLTRVKALSDPNRLLCMMLLRRRPELCACELQAATGLTHATVSHHMGVLVGARLVRAHRRGKWIYYSLVAKGDITS
ncbi:MAG: ArsR/SmtB family transcription factor [Thermoplasmata archaeon]